MIGASPFCTYRGVADAWECDQMQHMNVKFISERLSRADRFLFASLILDLSEAETAPAIWREAERITFRREIKAGRPFLVESQVLLGKSDTFVVRHDMKFADTGELSVRAVSRYRVTRSSAALRPPMIDAGSEGDEPLDFAEPFLDANVALIESGRSYTDAPDHSDGDLRRETLVRLVNHAASCAGLDRGRCWDANGRLVIGSATLEISIRSLVPLRSGAPIVLRSGLKARSSKTLMVLHQVLNAATSVVTAEATSTHVFFDIASRIAVRIPVEVSLLIAQQQVVER